MSGGFYHQPERETETCFMPQFQTLNPQLRLHSLNPLFSRNPSEKYCTLESSFASGNCINFNSPSTISFSSSESPVSQSDMSGSCITDDQTDLKDKLKELETAMMGPDSDIIDSYNTALQIDNHLVSQETSKLVEVMEMISQKDLKRVLVACAKAVSDDDTLMTQWLMDELRQMVSVSGEPMQRLGAYMLEGLVAKLTSSGSSIYKALKCKVPASSELLSYMHVLYEVCPYFKFGYMSTNGAIAEATKDESRVHIIDFQIGQGSQWVTLIQAFAARPGGPPHIRITGIDDSVSAYARGGGLSIVGRRLSRLAALFKVPFEFSAASLSGSEAQPRNLGVRPGEALVANFPFMLHHMADESVSIENHRDRLLRLVRSLNPKVVTVIEQECNTNTAAFFPRFLETLDYYTAMFESIDATLSRDQKDRINIEQHCLARDIVNLIACEGVDRVERHELHGKWRSRFTMAGFKPYPLSSLVNSTIKALLKNYNENYRLEERNEALYLGWMARDLVAASAWQCS